MAFENGPINVWADVFQWNLHESTKFLADSMYRTLLQLNVLVDKNKNNGK
jgi:hypothetical protein